MLLIFAKNLAVYIFQPAASKKVFGVSKTKGNFINVAKSYHFSRG